jgi:HEAT repeat protein
MPDNGRRFIYLLMSFFDHVCRRRFWLSKLSQMTLLLTVLTVIWLVASELAAGNSPVGQGNDRLTPIQREIEHQRQRLASTELEERRDALMRLGNLKRPEASRAAAAGLNDLAPMVRVTAAHAVLSLPPQEVAMLLIPLLRDKSEFVRRETAYALGEIHSRAAVGPLTESLLGDKKVGVRAAAAVTLGQIGDESATGALSQVLAGSGHTQKKKAQAHENEFVMRAAARSLGQIRSRAAVPVLIATLENEANGGDVRREAATALGLIGDRAAEPALRAAFASADPYLSEVARAALRRLAAGTR